MRAEMVLSVFFSVVNTHGSMLIFSEQVISVQLSHERKVSEN